MAPRGTNGQSYYPFCTSGGVMSNGAVERAGMNNVRIIGLHLKGMQLLSLSNPNIN